VVADARVDPAGAGVPQAMRAAGPVLTRPAPLFASERQAQIAARARRDGRVDVADLGKAFGVTTETIRRDLKVLQEMGLVRRVHGGAIPADGLYVVPNVAQRAGTMTEAKRAIARAALEELPAEGAILIDAGTTAVQLAELLPGDRELTVVTNTLPIAQAVVEKPRVTVHLLGGRVRPQTLASVGEWALHALSEVTLDVAFMGTQGLSVARGLTTPDASEAAVKRAMVSAARRVVVLADHTKLESEYFSIVAPLSAVHLVVTDSAGSDEPREALVRAGVEVRVVHVAGYPVPSAEAETAR